MKIAIIHHHHLKKIGVVCRNQLVLFSMLMLIGPDALAATFSDFFNAVSYSNQDGSAIWTGDWIEAGDDGSPVTGDIRIISSELRLQNKNQSISRQVDLTGFASGTLSFDYHQLGFDNNRDEVFVEIRSGGGGWTQLDRFRGPGVAASSASYAIPAANFSASTQIRFRTGDRLGGNDQFFVDNVVIDAFKIVPVGTYADFFGSVSYGNQDGDLDWSSSWAEGNDDGSPASGDVRITGGELLIQNSSRQITRGVDLSGYDSADFSFDFRALGFDDKKDEIFVEIRSGGGAWTLIQRLRGAGVGSGSILYSIPDGNLVENTEIRIRAGNKLGAADQFFVDNVIISAFGNDSTVLDHFRVSLASGIFGINCVPHQLKVMAHNSSHITIDSWVGEIQLATTTLSGNWSDAGLGNAGVLINGAAGDGVAIYQFAVGDLGEVDLYLDYVNGTINIVGINVSDTSDLLIIDDSIQTIQFSPTGFTITQNPLSNPPPNPINDSVTTQVAGSNFTVYLAAFGQTPTDPDCGIIEAYTGVHELHFWVGYDDPASGTIVPTVNGLVALDQECVIGGIPDCGAVANKQSVAFVNGQSSVSVKYKDVGSIMLNAKDDDFQPAQGLTISGSSGNFVVQPSDFVITTIETTGSVANPGTTSVGAKFVMAAESFHTVVQVTDAEGSLVPNYGNEFAAETVRLDVTSLVYPVGGVLGSFANATSFSATATNGEFENSTVSWSDVGTITMTAGVGDSDYLGSGNVTGAVSGNVGRFYAANFLLASSSVVDSCASGSSTYMSQPEINVDYVLRARNLNNATVLNYDDLDLGYIVALPVYHAENANDGVDLAGRLSIASGQWDDGELAFSSTIASFDRLANPDGPYSSTQLGLQIIDTDGTDFSALDFKPDGNNNCVVDGDCSGVAIGSTLNLSFGRMHLKNGFGPELAAIPMFWQTEYWDGASFVISSDDHCTALALTDVSFGGATTAVDAAGDTITVTIGVASVFNFADPGGARDCLTATDIIFCDGKAGLQYGAPGAVVTYPISVNLTSLPFLQFDWDQDGNYDDAGHPPTNINFQSYRGHDRVIYWQETMR